MTADSDEDAQPDAYGDEPDALTLAESLAALDRSMRDIRAGRTRPAKDAIRQIAEQLGLNLQREP